MKTESIAIKPANAEAIRQTLRQLDTLNAQLTGAVNALAVSLEVPTDWRFDTDKMVFTPPPTKAQQQQAQEISHGAA